MDNVELKPCPFCGSDELSYGWSSPGFDGTQSTGNVECHSCNALIYTHGGEAEAIAAWNTRPDATTIEALQAQVARLEQRLEVVPGMSESVDGISCRDDTIKLQDDRIAKLQAQVAAKDAAKDAVLVRAEKWLRACSDWLLETDLDMKCPDTMDEDPLDIADDLAALRAHLNKTDGEKG